MLVASDGNRGVNPVHNQQEIGRFRAQGIALVLSTAREFLFGKTSANGWAQASRERQYCADFQMEAFNVL